MADGDQESAPIELIDRLSAIERHVRQRFDGHPLDIRPWREGPYVGRLQRLSIIEVGPGPRFGDRTYITLGVSALFEKGHGTEFVLIADGADTLSDHHGRLLAMVAHYHAGTSEDRLNFAHTAPIGGTWTPESELTHVLITWPYPLGVRFAECPVEGGDVRFAWVLPIHESERKFIMAEGMDAFEDRYLDAMPYWDPLRAAVV